MENIITSHERQDDDHDEQQANTKVEFGFDFHYERITKSVSDDERLCSNLLKMPVDKITLNKLKCGFPMQIVVICFWFAISRMPSVI